MREREGINSLSAELRSALHRIMAGVRVSEVDLLDGIESRKPELNVDPVFPELRFRIQDGESRKLDHFNPSGAAVDVRFESDPVCMEGIEASETKSEKIDCRIRVEEPVRVDANLPMASAKSVGHFIFQNVKAINAFSEPIRIDTPWRLKMLRMHLVKRDNDRILDIPMTVRACDWASLERDFILKCWDALKKKAIGKLGRDPGRKLEMLGVYKNVNLTLVRRSEFVHTDRELRLYFNRDRSTWKNKPGNCVIIIGHDRDSGAIIQVVLHDD